MNPLMFLILCDPWLSWRLLCEIGPQANPCRHR